MIGAYWFKFKLLGVRIGVRIGCRAERFNTRQEAYAHKDSKAPGLDGYTVHFCGFCEGFHLYVRQLKRREIVFQNQGNRCADCGKSFEKLTIHHKVPQSEGGTNTFENLVGLCVDCHRKRHGHFSMKAAKRRIVRRFLSIQRQNPYVPNTVIRDKMIEAGIIPKPEQEV